MNHLFVFGVLVLLVAAAALTAGFADPRPALITPVALTDIAPAPAIENGSSGAPLISRLDQRAISVTNGIKHSVPLEEILGGGPPQDGIPSIDDPKFVGIKEAATFVNDQSPGIAVSFNGFDRFYPYQILVWHEIVNDTFADQRVLVTYCPLCFSGVVYD